MANEYDLPTDVDEAAIARMRFVAKLLDDAVRIPVVGVRVGIDPILGILPGSGDLVTGAISLYIVVESARLGVSWQTLLRMLANVGLDAAVGSVPVAGDVFDVFWKANKRNLDLALSDLSQADEPLDEEESVTIAVE